jgi:hypothetical protein
MPESRGRQWDEAHDQLKVSMQKEIGIMREILANMHSEELSLMLNDRGSWNYVMQERAQLIDRLSHFRMERIEATKKIKEMVCLNDAHKQASVEDLLPTQEENSCEILSLRDQMMALMERINFQNCRNEVLFFQVEHQLDLPHHPSGHPMQQQQAKSQKKASIATYNFKR